MRVARSRTNVSFRKRELIRSRCRAIPWRDESRLVVIPCESLGLITGASAVCATSASHAGGVHMHVPRVASGEKGDAEIHARAAGGRRRSPHDLDQFLYRIHDASREFRLGLPRAPASSNPPL